MNLQAFFTNLGTFLNSNIIPFLLALAFVVFLWNIVRYFIIEGANEREHEKARSTALYGILAFVLILSLAGIINLFIDSFGVRGGQPIQPDYLRSGGSTGGGNNATYPYAEEADIQPDP